jgi:hypothetical protein
MYVWWGTSGGSHPENTRRAEQSLVGELTRPTACALRRTSYALDRHAERHAGGEKRLVGSKTVIAMSQIRLPVTAEFGSERRSGRSRRSATLVACARGTGPGAPGAGRVGRTRRRQRGTAAPSRQQEERAAPLTAEGEGGAPDGVACRAGRRGECGAPHASSGESCAADGGACRAERGGDKAGYAPEASQAATPAQRGLGVTATDVHSV